MSSVCRQDVNPAFTEVDRFVLFHPSKNYLIPRTPQFGTTQSPQRTIWARLQSCRDDPHHRELFVTGDELCRLAVIHMRG
jgi:hypothetical protein